MATSGPVIGNRPTTYTPSINGDPAPIDNSKPAGNVGSGNLGNTAPIDDVFRGAGFARAAQINATKPVLPTRGSGTVSENSAATVAALEAALAAGINSPEEAMQLLAVVNTAMMDLKARATETDMKSRNEALKVNQANQLAKIKEANDKATQAENKSWWQKLWGVVSKVLNAVGAIAMTAVAVATANPVLMFFAAQAIWNVALDVVNGVRSAMGKPPLDWPRSLGQLVVLGLDAAGIVDKNSKTGTWLAVGLDVAVALAGGVYAIKAAAAGAANAVSKLSDAATKVAQITIATTSLGAAGATIGQGIVSIDVANLKYDANKAKLEGQALQVSYQRLMAIMQQLMDILQQAEQNKVDVLAGATESLNQKSQAIVATTSRNYS